VGDGVAHATHAGLRQRRSHGGIPRSRSKRHSPVGGTITRRQTAVPRDRQVAPRGRPVSVGATRSQHLLTRSGCVPRRAHARHSAGQRPRRFPQMAPFGERRRRDTEALNPVTARTAGNSWLWCCVATDSSRHHDPLLYLRAHAQLLDAKTTIDKHHDANLRTPTSSSA
jgi:hypothetical protein